MGIAMSIIQGKKKVLFLASVYIHLTSFHIPYMLMLQECGYEIHAAASNVDGKMESLELLGIKCWDIPFSRSPYSIKNISAIKSLNNLFTRIFFDLIHVHTPVAAFLGRGLARLNKQGKVIYTAHGFHFYKGGPWLNWLIYYPIERIASRWTDALITINREDFEFARRYLLRSCNVFYVHGVGIDISTFYPSQKLYRATLRGQLGYKEDDFVLITVAELNSNKNHAQIIKALAPVVKKNKKVYWLIVGEGITKAKLKSLVRYMDIIDNVSFLGYRTDVPELLNCADAFILTSRREGLPRCIMEAMAVGLPVIASNIRGVNDLVKNDENGYLVELDNIEHTTEAILNLINQREKGKLMGRKGRELVEKYNLDNVMVEMENIYRRFL